MEPYLDDFNVLVQAFSEDIMEYVKEKFGVAPVSLMIGGGNSRFVRVPDNPKMETHLLSPAFLESENVSPDLIQLMGAKKLMETGVEPYTAPTYEEILKKRSAAREGRYAETASVLMHYGAAMVQRGFSFIFRRLNQMTS
jgi:hypothetical protein